MMGTESNLKVHPKVVKLEKAFKLAEKWVDSMSGSATSEQDELEIVGRPERLGLGAKVILNERTTSIDPVERKLLGKLNAIKQKSLKISEGASPEKENSHNDSDDDEEPESKIKALSKKRAQSIAMPKTYSKRYK